MKQKSKGLLALATAGAIALTAVAPLPAIAAPVKKPTTIEQQSGALEIGARKRHRRHSNRDAAVALGMFGAVAGTIASIAAAERARKYERSYGYYGYGHPYGPGPYAYGPPAYGPYYGY